MLCYNSAYLPEYLLVSKLETLIIDISKPVHMVDIPIKMVVLIHKKIRISMNNMYVLTKTMNNEHYL